MESPPLPTVTTALLGLLVVVAMIGIALHSRRWTAYPSRLSALLSSPSAPLVAGLVTVVIVRVVWGSLSEPGVVHDERAYLLQAQIFAQGHWTAPSPPIPAFFEQMHVFVQPAVFAKYPPAHALMLVPGIVVGLPGLMPALLAGVSGALIYWLAGRLANQWVALLTWWLWTTAWANLHWAASYFSETTSTAMWLCAAWATFRWLDSGRRRYLLLAAAGLSWGFEARPLTMLALSLPLTWAIVQRLRVTKRWRDLIAPLAVSAAVLALGPIWNQQTLRDWRLNPYSYYSTVYFPFDKPGLGVDASPPLQTVPPELAAVGDWSREVHAAHVLSALPRTLYERIAALFIWCTDGWRLALGLLILAAAGHGFGAERVGVITVAVLFAAYLAFAHPPMWIVYYVELLPIVYYLAARELGRIFHKFGGIGRETNNVWQASVANASLAALLVLIPLGVSDVFRVRAAVDRRNAFHRQVEATLDRIPSENAIVFVSYPPSHNPHLAVTRNEPDLAAATRWLVYDRGTRNSELRAIAPERAAYRLNLGAFRLEALPHAAR